MNLIKLVNFSEGFHIFRVWALAGFYWGCGYLVYKSKASCWKLLIRSLFLTSWANVGNSCGNNYCWVICRLFFLPNLTVSKTVFLFQ